MKCALLVLVISLDSFVASIAYGSKRIKIPFSSTLIINLICSLFLASSIFIGAQFKKLIPGNIASLLSFLILLSLGIFYLFESILKSYLKSKASLNRELKFKMSNFRFMVNIYVDQTSADIDYSKSLDSKEALYLASALSLDSLAIGFGSSLDNINYLALILLSLVVGMISIKTGLLLGRTISKNRKIDLSWLAGLILVGLAIRKLF